MEENETGKAEVHSRLYSEKLKKDKNYVNLKQKKKEEDEEHKGKRNKPKEIIKKKEEINELVTKLHKEAEGKKQEQEKLRQTFIKKEAFKDELTTKKSQNILLEKFVSQFEHSLLGLVEKKSNAHLSFEELVYLFKAIGFLKYDYEKEEINQIMSKEYKGVKEEIKKMQKENELSDDEKAKLKKIEEIILIKEAWTFIKNSSSLPNNINNDNNNKLEEEPKLNEEVIFISNNHAE